MILIIFYLLSVSHGVPVEEYQVGYERYAWLRNWDDEDGDCLNTRQEVLIQESLVTASVQGCKVVGGLWYDHYTDAYFTDPSDLDTDHLVPLKEAYESGGYRWSSEEKRKYSNDSQHPEHLIMVSKSANRSKGAKSPDEWMPPNAKFHCAYLSMWFTIKSRYHLSMDTEELEFVTNSLKLCQEKE